MVTNASITICIISLLVGVVTTLKYDSSLQPTNVSVYGHHRRLLEEFVHHEISGETRERCREGEHEGEEDCVFIKCLSDKTLSSLINSANERIVNSTENSDACPTSLYYALGECVGDAKDNAEKGAEGSLSRAKVWGFGFLFMALVNLSSFAGVVILPFTKRPFFKWLLQFLISLAAGTMASCAMFFLLPDAFALGDYDPDFVWKAATVMAAIVLFFNVERLLHLGVERFRRRKPKLEALTVVTNGNENGKPSRELTLLNEKEMEFEDTSTDDSDTAERTIAPVAWMILVGDSLHRLVDGVSVGAAFSLNFAAGVSLSVAIVLEEFPHGLGDFAMLLKAGMSRKQVVLANLVMALSGFIGLTIGITIGEDEGATRWVFAAAGGIFLYIALVDMLNDVNRATEEDADFRNATCYVFLLQNFGMLLGGCSMLVLAAYSDNITLGDV